MRLQDKIEDIFFAHTALTHAPTGRQTTDTLEAPHVPSTCRSHDIRRWPSTRTGLDLFLLGDTFTFELYQQVRRAHKEQSFKRLICSVQYVNKQTQGL